MAGRVFVCTSFSDDPFLNLALEDMLFRRMGTEDQILFLWQSRPCVVIGRFQNPWVECSLEELERDGADLVRRQSGGGTVYHDGGNSNFTFLCPAAAFDADENLGVVTSALDNLGIHAEISPRHDILVEGFKVSGSAFRKKRDRVLHHGTLLIAADRERLTRYLAAPDWNIEAKGVASVRSRVINLVELRPGMNHSAFCGAAAEVFLGGCHRDGGGDGSGGPRDGGSQAVSPTDAAAPIWPGLTGGVMEIGASDLDGEGQAYRDTLTSWEWRFGKTPAFTQRVGGIFRGRSLDLALQVREGRVSGVFPGTEEEKPGTEEEKPGTEEEKPGTEEAWAASSLSERLAGVRYGRREIAAALTGAAAAGAERGTEELGKWLLARLEGR